MKNTFFNFIAACFLTVIANVANSQTTVAGNVKTPSARLSYGIQFGSIMTGAKFKVEANNPYNVKGVEIRPSVGFQFGGQFGYHLDKKKLWMVRANCLLSVFNTSFNYERNLGNHNLVKLEATNCALPLVLVRNFTLNSQNKVYLFGGVRGDYNFTSNADKIFQNSEENLATKSAYLMSDFGLGIKHSLNLVDAGLELHFNQSFTNTLIRQNQHVYSQSLSALRPTLMSLNLIIQN